MDTMEVLTLLLVIFAALSYIDNHKKKQHPQPQESQDAFLNLIPRVIGLTSDPLSRFDCTLRGLLIQASFSMFFIKNHKKILFQIQTSQYILIYSSNLGRAKDNSPCTEPSTTPRSISRLRYVFRSCGEINRKFMFMKQLEIEKKII